MRATQSFDKIKAWDWGLLRCNDPDFTWEETPIKDISFGLTDEELDNLSGEENEKINRFYKMA